MTNKEKDLTLEEMLSLAKKVKIQDWRVERDGIYGSLGDLDVNMIRNNSDILPFGILNNIIEVSKDNMTIGKCGMNREVKRFYKDIKKQKHQERCLERNRILAYARNFKFY